MASLGLSHVRRIGQKNRWAEESCLLGAAATTYVYKCRQTEVSSYGSRRPQGDWVAYPASSCTVDVEHSRKRVAEPPDVNKLFPERVNLPNQMAEEAKRRAEIARLREHVEPVVKLKGLDIDIIQAIQQ